MNHKNNLAVKSVADQLGNFERRSVALQEFFPDLNIKLEFDSSVINGTSVPEGIDFYPFIAWRRFDTNYAGAVIALIRAFRNKRSMQIIFGESKLSQVISQLQCQPQTVSSVTGMFDQQIEYGIKALPVQVDGRYKGLSVKNTLDKLSSEGEFPLYLFSVLQMLIVDPNILSNYGDTGIVCAGDRLDFNGVEYAPVLRIDESGELVLDSIPIEQTTQFYSLATGFVLK